MKTSVIHALRYSLWVLFIPAISTAQDRELTILQKFVDKRKHFESVSYGMELKLKSFSMEDTSVYHAKVNMIRNPFDTLYEALFTVTIEDTLWYGYDGQKIMRGELESSTLIIGDPVRYLGLFVKSTWVDNFLDYGFLKKGQGPVAYLQNPDIDVTFIDTMIGEWPCLGVNFKMPDEGDIYNRNIFMAIDTVEFVARSRMYSAFFQGNEQYTNWLFEDVHYGQDTSIEELNGTFEKTFIQIKQYIADTTYMDKPSKYNYAMLAGKYYGRDVDFKMEAVKANLIILDFWYTSCYPCIKGIPSVNRLTRDYKDKGVKVFGVNMIDNEVKSKARLEKFFQNNLMEYQPIMVNPEMAAEIGIKSYPTLIVLDKDYNILYLEDGFTEDLYEKVAKVLDANL